MLHYSVDTAQSMGVSMKSSASRVARVARVNCAGRVIVANILVSRALRTKPGSTSASRNAGWHDETS